MTESQTQAPASPRQRRPRARATWLIPAAFVFLSVVPIIAGAARITDLSLGGPATEASARFFASPIPVIAHIISASVYLVLGAFQFAPRLRVGRPSWHRIAGRILVPLGLIAAFSGMWMGIFYDRLVYDMIVRLAFGALMAASILLGLRAILRRDVRTHRAWMIRGYAVGIGAGTQVFVALAWLLVTGGAATDAPTATALLVAGWVINLVVAEVAIRRSVA